MEDLLKTLKTEDQARYKQLKGLLSDFTKIFEWYDGILINAMKTGSLLLIDEISLAEDAVRDPHHTSRVLKSSAGSVRWVVR